MYRVGFVSLIVIFGVCKGLGWWSRDFACFVFHAPAMNPAFSPF
jgi:hypothetical protein